MADINDLFPWLPQQPPEWNALAPQPPVPTGVSALQRLLLATQPGAPPLAPSRAPRVAPPLSFQAQPDPVLVSSPRSGPMPGAGLPVSMMAPVGGLQGAFGITPSAPGITYMPSAPQAVSPLIRSTTPPSAQMPPGMQTGGKPGTPIPSQPGLTVVPSGTELPTAQSDLSTTALASPLPQGGQPGSRLPGGEQSPQQPPQSGATGLAGMFARLSPEQRLAAMLHAIKGDYGAIATIVQGVTPGTTAADTHFGQQFADWRTGGLADVQRQLARMGVARGLLQGSIERGEPITGGWANSILSYLPGAVESQFNPEGRQARQAVMEVVQRGLRAVLGPQFTEREGIALMDRAFDPTLSPQENLRRLNVIMAQVEAAAASKEEASQYFERFGTLRGWHGRLPSAGDFYDALDRLTGSTSVPQSTPSTTTPPQTPPPTGRTGEDLAGQQPPGGGFSIRRLP